MRVGIVAAVIEARCLVDGVVAFAFAFAAVVATVAAAAGKKKRPRSVMVHVVLNTR